MISKERRNLERWAVGWGTGTAALGTAGVSLIGGFEGAIDNEETRERYVSITGGVSTAVVTLLGIPTIVFSARASKMSEPENAAREAAGKITQAVLDARQRVSKSPEHIIDTTNVLEAACKRAAQASNVPDPGP